MEKDRQGEGKSNPLNVSMKYITENKVVVGSRNTPQVCERGSPPSYEK